MKEITKLCPSCNKEFSFVPVSFITQANRKYCSRPCALTGNKKRFDSWNKQSERIRIAKQEDTKYLWK